MARTAPRVSEIRAENLLTELLTAQGWEARRPPNGDLLRQSEYKDHAALLALFRGRSKSGDGDGLPDALLVDRVSIEPLAVIETKANKKDIDKAEREAKDYAQACVEAGHSPLAIALAGTSEDGFLVRVFKWKASKWKPVTYDGHPIGWIPNRADTERLRPPNTPTELRPTVPPPEVLAGHADEVNRLLRESGIKDEFRPAVVAAIMLALWKSKGDIRRSVSHILQDINEACGKAFWAAGKPDLAKSLRVDEANATLAVKARRIVSIFEHLNVTVLTAEHDYLGQLYETFFQYTGGNTIGQYFTPRHIAEFMAELAAVDSEDITLDPACGTGGFLIAAMHRISKQRKLSRAQVVKLVRTKLIGFDKEPVTAALCIANMILRGDGSSGVHRGDVFTTDEYPSGKANVVLMNPPFPHRKTDTPSEQFLRRALEGLTRGGRGAIIMPTSQLVKGDKKPWREQLLETNTLEAIIGLPDDLFEPFASSYTGVVFVTKGVPHPKGKHVFFARITNDGYEIQKKVKVRRDGEQLTEVLSAFGKRRSVPGLCGWAEVDPDSLNLGPGLYVPAKTIGKTDTIEEVRALVRNKAAFVVSHAPQLFQLERAVARGKVQVTPRGKRRHENEKIGPSIGGHFYISYGQKELHSKRGLQPGSALVISSSGIDNGCYGFFDFENLIAPPFVTAPSTGSIGEAHVQEWPCGVTDDCLILIPKPGVTREALYIAAAVIRRESWRYSYGMKMTPERIANYPMPLGEEIVQETAKQLETARSIGRIALEAAEDEYDAKIARERLEGMTRDPSEIVSGAELEASLERMG